MKYCNNCIHGDYTGDMMCNFCIGSCFEARDDNKQKDMAIEMLTKLCDVLKTELEEVKDYDYQH